MSDVRVAQRGEKVTKERVQEIVENTEDKYLSIRSLMRKQESKVIIGDPREYQMELFERAKQQNIIAVLDTGPCCSMKALTVNLTKNRLWQDPDRCSATATRY